MGRPDRHGSYGLNDWLFQYAGETDAKDHFVGPGRRVASLARHLSRMPAFFDCRMAAANPAFRDALPEHEEACTPCMMWMVCIDRHQGGINVAFMDGSVRKVGLKELWTLMWFRDCDPTGPWTKAGGVRPEDWPDWMQQFRDY
jgi:prepilin-type processing-associated H-X9-DG protein